MQTPSRQTVLNANNAIRRGNARKPTRLPDGEVQFRIPEADWAVLMVLYPGLQARDSAERQAAWRAFSLTEHAKPYLVVRPPDQVRRSNNHRIHSR